MKTLEKKVIKVLAMLLDWEEEDTMEDDKAYRINARR